MISTDSPKKTVPLGIIVVNYKSHDETVEFVERELKKIDTPHVIVVVNNADDGAHGRKLAETLDAQLYRSDNMDSAPLSDRIVISEPENLGYGSGNDLGFQFIDQHFDTNWILISNNDLELIDERVVESMIEKGETDATIGAIGPRIRTPQNRDQSPHRYRSIWNLLILPKLFYPVWAVFKRMGIGLERVPNAKSGFYHRIMGCFFLVRTEAFRQADGFDDRTFLYGEEVILSARLRSVGFKTFYCAESSVLHNHRQTTSTHLSNRRTKEHVLNSLLIYFRYYDGQSKWVCRLARFADFVEARFYEPLIRFFKRILGLKPSQI